MNDRPDHEAAETSSARPRQLTPAQRIARETEATIITRDAAARRATTDALRRARQAEDRALAGRRGAALNN